MTPECSITVRSPADLLAATPYVLGFHPTDSVVILGLVGRLVTFAARHDLPPPGDDDLRWIAPILTAQEMQRAALIGYGPPGRVTKVLDALTSALAEAGIPVVEALRVTEGRWWSYRCAEPRCCPPEGLPCPPPDGPVAAAAVYHGQVALPNRQALADQVAALVGEPRAAMTAATDRARARLAELVRGEAGDRAHRRAGRTAVRDAERRQRAGRPLTVDETAWLTVLLVDDVVLDYALDRADGQTWRIGLWTDVLRRAEPDLVAAPGCLLAYAAWRCGRGALARVAVDRALKEEPGHHTAALLDRLLAAGIGPDAIAALTPPALIDARRRAG